MVPSRQAYRARLVTRVSRSETKPLGFRWRQRKKKPQQENWNIAEHAENLAQIQGLELSRLPKGYRRRFL